MINLPEKIKVRVNEDNMGNVTLIVLSQGDINALDDIIREETYDLYGYIDQAVFYQNTYDIVQFLTDVPKARYRIQKNDYTGYKIGRYTYEVNDNHVFYIDSEMMLNLLGVC